MRETLRLAGQVVMAGFEGQAASADIKHLIRHFGLGGVILFARNVDGPEQLAELLRELQDCARSAGQAQPLLVGVDQEGGRVARLRAPWTVWPTARAVGRVASEDQARAMGEALADELRASGITLDFAPVVDVDTNPANPIIGDRSFSDDPARVGRLGVALLQGLQSRRVAACAKHFPGHGDTVLDSHLDLPTIDLSLGRLEDVELRPFREAIAAGVATVMVGHLLVREWDPDWPATLSRAIVHGLLRERLRFEGVIVADDLEMKAVAARWPPEELGRRSMAAGCDLLLVCRSHDTQVRVLESLVRAVETEDLPWQRLEDAAARVRRLKQAYVEPYAAPRAREARLAAGAQRAQALARALAQDAGLPA